MGIELRHHTHRIAERGTLSDMREKMAYTIAEVAEMTGLSARTITRMFENEKGVILIERPESMHKRRYRSIRIPRAVYERVIRRITV
jgi:transcriptional regulator GlxA family with amidase domain